MTLHFLLILLAAACLILALELILTISYLRFQIRKNIRLEEMLQFHGILPEAVPDDEPPTLEEHFRRVRASVAKLEATLAEFEDLKRRSP
jgi:hypothetical protein